MGHRKHKKDPSKIPMLSDFVVPFKGFTFSTVKIILILQFLNLSACSLEASIAPLTEVAESFEPLKRKNPDLTYGEIVTTSTGYQFSGTFGEISEKTESITGNGWQVEGVFYE